MPRRDGRRLAALADAHLAEPPPTACTPPGRWQRAPDDARVDAALLLPALRGACPPTTRGRRRPLPAVRTPSAKTASSTASATTRARSRHAEGAFILCGFWMALAATSRATTTAAPAGSSATGRACGPPGLFAEEYDVAQRQLRGNLPQAFVHAAVLETHPAVRPAVAAAPADRIRYP